MKLLQCKKCLHVFSITTEVRGCDCGEAKGKYLEDGLHAVYTGDATPLGFANSSFVWAKDYQPDEGAGENFIAFVIPKVCKTFIKQSNLNI